MKFLSYIIVIFVLTSCSVSQYQQYNVPQYMIKSHEEVMSEFSNKSKIVMEFGAPNSQFESDSILVMTYELGTIETGESNSISITSSTTRQSAQSTNESYFRSMGYAMTPGNPLYSGSAGTSVSNNFAVTRTASNSSNESFKKYASFWLLNGQVIKWESFGIDKSYRYTNPSYDPVRAKQVANYNAKQTQKEQMVALSSIFGITILAMIFAFR